MEATGSNSNTETPPPPPVWQPDGEKWRSFQDNFDIEGAYAYLQEGIDFGIGLSDKTLREIFDILAPIAKEQFPAYDYLMIKYHGKKYIGTLYRQIKINNQILVLKIGLE